MTASHVLIVDDDLALLEALPEALRLRMGGVAVDTADSGAAALERIAARDYDAIVVDIKMPGMDGLELLAEIRGRRPDTPILMITGHGEHALAIQALRGGACDFIQKPIDRDDFVAALRRTILAHALSRRVKDRQSALARCAFSLAWVSARSFCFCTTSCWSCSAFCCSSSARFCASAARCKAACAWDCVLTASLLGSAAAAHVRSADARPRSGRGHRRGPVAARLLPRHVAGARRRFTVAALARRCRAVAAARRCNDPARPGRRG